MPHDASKQPAFLLLCSAYFYSKLMTSAVDAPFIRTAQLATRYQAWSSEVVCLMWTQVCISQKMHSACDESREEYGMRRLLVALIATTVFGKGSVSSFIIFTVIRLVTIHMLMLKQRSGRADPSSRGFLPTVARRCVWSRNVEKEEAKARYRAVKIQPQCVVTPGKQTKQRSVHSFWLIGCRIFRELLFGCWNSPRLPKCKSN